MDKEFEKFLKLDQIFHEYESIGDIIEGTRIALEFVRAAVKSQDDKVIQQGWQYCSLLKSRVEILDKIDSSEEEAMSLAAEIFRKLPIEIELVTITRVEDESKGDENDIGKIKIFDPRLN